jgi:hypothetical protein
MAHCWRFSDECVDSTTVPIRLHDDHTMMRRIVAPEALDGLDASDPRAVRSRRDLRRVHRVMGTRSIVSRAFRAACDDHPRTSTLHVLELGAGDGGVMLGIARALAGEWPDVRLTLLDRQDVVSSETLRAYASVGWSVNVCVSDALEWASGGAEQDPGFPDEGGRWDVVIVNLFLHHFEGAELASLVQKIGNSADRFIACEPRRSKLALIGSHLIGLTGAGLVTREDAVLSVHAGFCGHEISACWPDALTAWEANEYGAGLFSHCFVAQRKDSALSRTP